MIAHHFRELYRHTLARIATGEDQTIQVDGLAKFDRVPEERAWPPVKGMV
jgi:hypothetical protein